MLGLVASGPRKIKEGKNYEQFFAPATGRERYLSYQASNFNTLDYMAEIVADTLPQTAKIAAHLKRANLNATCKAIFDFVYNHYQYRQDSPEREEIRSPYRAWRDRTAGVDCDCYSVTISSILTNLGIAHAFKMTKYDGKSYYQHVYIVVPKNQEKFTEKDLQNRENYYVIDPVLSAYNEEKKPSAAYHKIFNLKEKMSLNGVEGSTAEHMAEQLLGLQGKRRDARRVRRASRKAKRQTRRVARTSARAVKRTARAEKRAVRRSARAEKRTLRKAIRQADSRDERKALRAEKRAVRKTKRASVKDLRKTGRTEARAIRKTGRQEGRAIKRTGRTQAQQVKKGTITKAQAMKLVAARKAAAQTKITAKAATAKAAIVKKAATAKTRISAISAKAIAEQKKNNLQLARQIQSLKKADSLQNKRISASAKQSSSNSRRINAIEAARKQEAARKKALQNQSGVRTYAPKEAKVIPLQMIRNITVS